MSKTSLHTPQGIITEITDDQAEILAKNDAFKRHEKRGFISILKQDPRKPDDVAADMSDKDKGRQLTEAQLESEGKTVKTGKSSK